MAGHQAPGKSSLEVIQRRQSQDQSYSSNNRDKISLHKIRFSFLSTEINIFVGKNLENRKSYTEIGLDS